MLERKSFHHHPLHYHSVIHHHLANVNPSSEAVHVGDYNIFAVDVGDEK